MVVAFQKNVKPAAFKSSVNYSSSAAVASAMQTRNLIGGQESHDADVEESNMVSEVGSLGMSLSSRHHRTVGNLLAVPREIK